VLRRRRRGRVVAIATTTTLIPADNQQQVARARQRGRVVREGLADAAVRPQRHVRGQAVDPLRGGRLVKEQRLVVVVVRARQFVEEGGEAAWALGGAVVGIIGRG
jgi:hypothetical protein